jgi:hypothetical protein
MANPGKFGVRGFESFTGSKKKKSMTELIHPETAIGYLELFYKGELIQTQFIFSQSEVERKIPKQKFSKGDVIAKWKHLYGKKFYDPNVVIKTTLFKQTKDENSSNLSDEP